MPETEHSTSTRLPIETIWDFVREMDHWAPFLTGYQSHRKVDASDSIWVVKGDVGVLTRTLEFRVHVTEWAGPHRVAFEIEGRNEVLRGEGEFRMEPASALVEPPPDAARRGRLARLSDRFFRFVFRLFHGRVARDPDAGDAMDGGGTRLTFRLRLDPGGPMAPMVSAMMKPALGPAAEDLANRIVAHLEARARGD